MFNFQYCFWVKKIHEPTGILGNSFPRTSLKLGPSSLEGVGRICRSSFAVFLLLMSCLMLIQCHFAYWGWAWGSHNGGFRGVRVFPFLSAQSLWPQLLPEVGSAVKTPVGTSMNSSLPYTLLFYLLVWFSVVSGEVKLLSCRRAVRGG